MLGKTALRTMNLGLQYILLNSELTVSFMLLKDFTLKQQSQSGGLIDQTELLIYCKYLQSYFLNVFTRLKETIWKITD